MNNSPELVFLNYYRYFCLIVDYTCMHMSGRLYFINRVLADHYIELLHIIAVHVRGLSFLSKRNTQFARVREFQNKIRDGG